MRALFIAMVVLPSTALALPPELEGPHSVTGLPDGVCAYWVDKDDDGKRDRDERLETPFAQVKPPDESRTETMDGRAVLDMLDSQQPTDLELTGLFTKQTEIWRRTATDEDEPAEPGTTIEDKSIQVRDSSGLLIAEIYEPAVHASDGFAETYEYEDGRLVASQQTGPGNSSSWTTYSYGSDGMLIGVRTASAMGACCTAGGETVVIREGQRIVRLVVDEFEEEATDGRAVETSRKPRARVATFEYRDGRIVAKREVGRSYSGHYATTTRYRYDCD